MKLSSVVFLVVVSTAAVLCVDPTEKMKMMMKIVNDCKESTGATNDDIAKLMIHAKPSSHEGKCMFSCVMESLGIIKVGKVDRHGLMDWGQRFNAPADILGKIADDCQSETDPDPCESAVKLGFCYKKAGAKYAIEMDL